MSFCIICNTEFQPSKNKKNQLCCFNKKCKTKRNNLVNAEYKKQWSLKNKERCDFSKQQWLNKNPLKRKEASSSYMKRNKAYYAEYSSLRSRAIKNATPVWADKNAIYDVYLEAEYMQLEVDHIIPLKHDLVCGLHVVENLQLLSRSDNAKKSNKYDVLCVVE